MPEHTGGLHGRVAETKLALKAWYDVHDNSLNQTPCGFCFAFSYNWLQFYVKHGNYSHLKEGGGKGKSRCLPNILKMPIHIVPHASVQLMSVLKYNATKNCDFFHKVSMQVNTTILPYGLFGKEQQFSSLLRISWACHHSMSNLLM